MFDEFFRLRSLYKGKASFLTILPDGTEVPWKSLSIGDYIKYSNSQDFPEDIEDEIFESCVSDEYLKKNYHTLKAGVVSTVVDNIIGVSIPNTLEEFDLILNHFRHRVHNNIFDQMVLVICQAFPSCTPLMVYDMKLEDFFHHVALAEKKLLDAGILTEPLALFSQQEQQAQKEKPKGSSRNLRDQWVAQQQGMPSQRPQMPRNLPVDPVPVPDYNGEETVITTQDMQELAMMNDGHEKADMDILTDQMLKETVGIYADYIDKMKSGEKITSKSIKTPEQRREEALKRAKKSEEDYLTKSKEHHEEQVKTTRGMEEKFRKHLPKRRHKKRR